MMKNLRAMNEMETRDINGGKTYVCPFCHNVSGSYLKVYAHAMAGCFKRNRYLKGLWDAGIDLVRMGALLRGYCEISIR